MAEPYIRRRRSRIIEAAEQNRRVSEEVAYASPLDNSSISEGGLDVIEKGKITLDGDDLKIILQILDGRGFITYQAANRSGLRADAAFWGDENLFVVAGPLRTESKASTGFGGSNLFLYPTYGLLRSGSGSANVSSLSVADDGWVKGYNANGRLEISPAGNVSLGGPGGGFQGHEDGAWSVGDPSLAVIQGSTTRVINLFGNGLNLNGTTTVNGSLSVTGAKQFLMDHPEKPGHTIRYGSTESPVSAIECRGRVEIGEDGTAEVTYPEHFAAILKPDTDVDVSLAVYGPDHAWCEPPTTTGTTIHGTPGTVVGWKAYGERIGADFQVVEEGSTEPPVPVPTTPEPEPTPEEAT